MLNPIKKITTPEKVQHALWRHAELATFVAGLLLGFVMGRM